MLLFSHIVSYHLGLLGLDIRKQNTTKAGARGKWGMLYFPVSLMSILNQTESAFFQHVGSSYFRRIPIQIIC